MSRQPALDSQAEARSRTGQLALMPMHTLVAAGLERRKAEQCHGNMMR